MANEKSPEEEEEPPMTPAMALAHYSWKLFLCVVYIVISAVLIRFNKWMMKETHFPHALALSACHMIICFVYCSVLYGLRPSIFTGMEATKGHRLGLLKWFVPIGLCFAIMLFGSNQAYLYCSVTFLQFMKEANAMLVFVLSCIVGLQFCTRSRFFIIVWVIVGASISVSGEVRFKWLGFIFQGMSQLAEVSRMVMGEIVLSGRKLDPLTYNLFLAPICFLVLAIANVVHWSAGTWVDFARMWPWLLANASVAFCLNVMVAKIIKECSAVGFVLCGLTKDIAIVIFSAMAFHENVTKKQAIAFVVTVAGVFFWSYMKINPTAFPVRILERLLCQEPEVPNEKATLIPKASLEKKV